MEARDVQRILDEREPRAYVDVQRELIEPDEDDVALGVGGRVVRDGTSALRIERLRSNRRDPGLRVVRDPHDVEALTVSDARLERMLRRQEEASPRADEGEGHRRILCVDRHEDVIRGPRLHRVRGFFAVTETVQGAAKYKSQVRSERPRTRRSE